MTHDEMETLIDFLKGAFPKLTEEQVETYSAMLMMEDAELATKAILAGVNDWKFPPAWAEIKERIRAGQPRQSTRVVEEAIADASIPFWVRQWIYARFVVKPPDLRPFREQHLDVVERGDEPAMGWMPGNEYELQAKAISDAMVRAKVAEVTGAAGMSTPLLELLGDA